jgi:RNA polymerase-binding transcription factor DksA
MTVQELAKKEISEFKYVLERKRDSLMYEFKQSLVGNSDLRNTDGVEHGFELEILIKKVAKELEIIEEILKEYDQLSKVLSKTCKDCGEKISIKRLKSIPYAIRCIDCASEVVE